MDREKLKDRIAWTLIISVVVTVICLITKCTYDEVVGAPKLATEIFLTFLFGAVLMWAIVRVF